MEDGKTNLRIFVKNKMRYQELPHRFIKCDKKYERNYAVFSTHTHTHIENRLKTIVNSILHQCYKSHIKEYD